MECLPPAIIARVKHDIDTQGYAVIDNFLDEASLDNLIQEAETLYEIARAGSDPRWSSDASQSLIYETVPTAHCPSEARVQSDIFRHHRTKWPLSAANWELLFSKRITHLIQSILCPEAVLYNDQYIIKPGISSTTSYDTTTNNVDACFSKNASSTAFQWHRDSDWCRNSDNYIPYVSLWIAVDDCSIDNGCLIVRPNSTPSIKVNDSQSSSQQPVALQVKAGTAVVMDSMLEHCSGPNKTKFSRRAWMPQFSARPFMHPSSSGDYHPVSLAVPLI